MDSSYDEISYWEKEHLYYIRDVLIIGAGLVGMHSAIALKKRFPDLKITLLERSTYSRGASTRNAGFACFGNMGEFVDDLNHMSESDALELMNMRYQGLQLTRKLLGDAAIDYEPSGSHEIVPKGTTGDYILEKIPFVNEHLERITGLAQVFKPGTESFGFANSLGSIFNPYEGELNTGKLFQSLRDLTRKLNIEILSGVDVIRYTHENQGLRVLTSEADFSCRKLILTTNAFTESLVPGLDIQPARGQILLTEPISDFRLKGIFFFDAGYYYWRMLDGGILLGGARNLDPQGETTFTYGSHPEILHELHEFLYSGILGNRMKPKIRMRWSGIMAMGSSKYPFMQPIEENVFAAVRMGGMGVALSALAGQKVLNWFEGQD